MKNLLFIIILLFSCSTFVKAQEEEQGERKWERMEPQSTFIPRTIVKEKEPIPYMPVREADVVWSKIIWRIIDCREKMNFPLYYPTVEIDNRRSLIQALVDGIQSGEIQAYGTDNEDFTSKLTPSEVIARFDAGDIVRKQEKITGDGDTTIVIKGQINWEEVREFLVKEEHYFDRHYSQKFIRIVGICPIRVYNKTLNLANDDDEVAGGQTVKRQLFWVFFPEARRILANTVSYTGNNELAQISFDDLFHKRRFESYIVAESNSINNRRINEYTRNGVQAIMESNRIKRDLMNFESDLWEY